MSKETKFDKDFKEWYLLQYPYRRIDCPSYSRFMKLPIEFRWGVCQKFFEEKDIIIGRENYDKDSHWVYTENEIYFDDEEWNYIEDGGLTLEEAEDKAKELYNQKQEK